MTTYSDDLISDLYKDARGNRPRDAFYAQWRSMKPEDRQAVWDGLQRELSEREALRATFEASNVVKVEQHIAQTLQTVAGSTRADAIRYLHDSYETDGDLGFLEYLLGVPYGYFNGPKVC